MRVARLASQAEWRGNWLLIGDGNPPYSRFFYAAALVARELASHLRLKLPTDPAKSAESAGGEGTGFSSEIETEMYPGKWEYGEVWRGNWLLIGDGNPALVHRPIRAVLMWRGNWLLIGDGNSKVTRPGITGLTRGEGTGFSSEIETRLLQRGGQRGAIVARELASHLRLKHRAPRARRPSAGCGEGTGFSSEIETRCVRASVPGRGSWRGNWLLIGDGNVVVAKAQDPNADVARELASHLRLKPYPGAGGDHPGWGWRGNWLLIGDGNLIWRRCFLGSNAVARELASHLRLKLGSTGASTILCSCGEGTGFSSEIETSMMMSTNSSMSAWRGNWLLIGDGNLFMVIANSAEELWRGNWLLIGDGNNTRRANEYKARVVARELASHLRLKLHLGATLEGALLCGEGTGFSSEIETREQCPGGTIDTEWRGNWLLIGDGNSASAQQQRWHTVVARELASHLRLKRI